MEGRAQSKTAMQRFLDGIERMGNMVPHPLIIFLILIAIVIVLSAVLAGFGASVSFERINPVTNEIEIATTGIRSLLNADGIRFMYESLVPNFMGFTAVGLMVAAMIGAGVAEAPHQAVRVRGVPGPRARVAAAGRALHTAHTLVRRPRPRSRHAQRHACQPEDRTFL